MSKILFLDVDGTMTNYSGEIPESTGKAIKLARQNGHKVYACTGRSRAEMPDRIWNMGIDGMIGGNGSYIEHHGKVLFHQTLTKEQCQRVVDWLHERGLEFYLEANSGLYASENFKEKSQPVMREYERRKGRQPKEVHEIHGMIYDETNLYRDDVNKISFILSTYQDHLDSKAIFTDLVANTWGGAGEIALFGDLGVKGIDKAVAIYKLLDFLKADIKDTFAFGDAKIDIPMFDICEVAVAVASGGDEAKAAADYITDAVDDNGIYNAFQHFNLI
ncbi:HAD family hydrolase [Carnobacteriaceae bacterium zg-C25]|nr:HAD family hydrolase [Carnobacteriaceae bacterium zg-C25]